MTMRIGYDDMDRTMTYPEQPVASAWSARRHMRAQAAFVDAGSRHPPSQNTKEAGPAGSGLLRNDKRQPRSAKRHASDQPEIVEATHRLEARDQLGRVSDEVEGFNGVALREALGLVRDAPRPAEARGMHPVREIVVGCSRVLVDPPTRGAHGGLGNEPERDGCNDLLEASPQADDDESRVEGGEHRRIRLQSTQALVAVDDLDVET